MDKFVALVKGQISHYGNQIERFPPSHPRHRPEQVALYRRLIAEHRDLLAYLEGQATSGIAPAATVVTAPTTPPADLSDLPPELLAELSESARGEVDVLVQILNERGGTASLDDILIDLYRKHREIGKRNVVANKLYRLARRRLVWPLPGKKGVYTTTPVAADDNSQDDANAGNENDEGPGGGTPGPSSNDMGAASSPGSPTKAASVGASPTASTKRRRDLFASSAIPTVRVPH